MYTNKDEQNAGKIDVFGLFEKVLNNWRVPTPKLRSVKKKHVIWKLATDL